MFSQIADFPLGILVEHGSRDGLAAAQTAENLREPISKLLVGRFLSRRRGRHASGRGGRIA